MTIEFGIMNLKNPSKVTNPVPVKYKVHSDCPFENIVDYEIYIDQDDGQGLAIIFDGELRTNARLAVTNEMAEQLIYQLPKDSGVTVAYVSEYGDIAGIQSLMKDVLQQNTELLTPWLIVTKLKPNQFPFIKDVLAMASDAGMHVLTLETPEYSNRFCRELLDNPFYFQIQETLI